MKKPILLGLFALLMHSVASAQPGVVVRDANLYNSPSADATVVTRISAGTQVEVLERSGGWKQIKAAPQAGWLRIHEVRDTRSYTRIPTEEKTADSSGFLAGLAKLSRRVSGFFQSPNMVSSENTATIGIRGRGAEDREPQDLVSAHQQIQQLAAVGNETIQDYLDEVGRRLVEASKASALPWSFTLVYSDSIGSSVSADAGVFLTTGYYAILEDEAQLATVLAHEMGQRIYNEVNSARQRTDFNQVFDADLEAVSLASLAGYDPYAYLDVLTTLASIPADNVLLLADHAEKPEAILRIDVLNAELDARANDIAIGERFTERFLTRSR